MKSPTELLVHGFDHDDVMFTARLVPGKVTTLRTVIDGDGDTAVGSIDHHAKDVITAMRDMLDGLNPTQA